MTGPLGTTRRAAASTDGSHSRVAGEEPATLTQPSARGPRFQQVPPAAASDPRCPVCVSAAQPVTPQTGRRPSPLGADGGRPQRWEAVCT